MKRNLFIFSIFLISNSAYALPPVAFTDEIGAHGCYKLTGDNRCVYTAFIDCKYNSDENYRLYGPIVGSMCDDFVYIYQENEKDLLTIEKLRKEVKRLKKQLKHRK